MKVKSESEVTQSCPTLSDPMDCSRPGSSAHGIFQTRVLEWGAIAFSEYRVQSLLNLFEQIKCGCFKPLCFGMIYYVVIVKLEKAMATHSSTLAWEIPWTEEPGRLQSMGSLRVGHD